MTQVITLSGDYNYEPWKIDGITNTEIDASHAEWNLANIGAQLNLYPVSVRDSGSVILTGGTIHGEVSLTLDWQDAYVNSAAVYTRDVQNILIQDWTVSRAWDAIRFSGSASDVFTVDNVWLSDVRDDGIENDNGMSGTVSNSLFDGVFVGISLADSDTGDQTGNLVTMDNVLIRMESYLYQGEVTHQSIFKVEEGKSPGLSLHDCVFAIEDVNHHGTDRLAIAWDSVVSSSNNYFLNLSDTPLPDDYPMPPAGFTILQGAEARAYWADARNVWIAEHYGTLGTNGADDLTGTSDANVIIGYNGNDLMAGVGGADKVLGQGGQDTVYGGAGADTINGGGGDDLLFGGVGADKFIFLAAGSDRVKHYQVGIDAISIGRGETGGLTDATQVVKTFASVVSEGVLFDFGNGDSILLVGLTSTAGLAGDLAII